MTPMRQSLSVDRLCNDQELREALVKSAVDYGRAADTEEAPEG